MEAAQDVEVSVNSTYSLPDISFLPLELCYEGPNFKESFDVFKYSSSPDIRSLLMLYSYST